LFRRQQRRVEFKHLGTVLVFATKGVNTMRLLRLGFVIVALTLPACAVHTPTAINPASAKPLEDIAPSELKVAPASPATSAPKQTEPARTPAAAAPDTSGKAEEAASARAADPKDAAGANIIKAPTATGAKP
jgi:hypothetical protein